MLTVNDWSGTPGVGNKGDHLFFTQDQSANLDHFYFDGYGQGAQEFQVGNYWEVTPNSMIEPIPTPEPSNLVAAFLFVILVGFWKRRLVENFFLRLKCSGHQAESRNL